MIIRRRKSAVIKVVIGFGAAWMFLLIVVAIFNAADIELKDYAKNENWGNALAGGAVDPSNRPPVIERPDLDRLRFQDAMRRGAEQEKEMNDQKEQEMKRREDERILRARDRIVPPFKDAFQQKKEEKDQNVPASTPLLPPDLKNIDENTRKLIEQGLIVPKWNILKEPMAKPSLNMTGENGQGISIIKEKLSPEERKKFDEGWQNNAFNEYASTLMSLHRSLPDIRDPECRELKYRDNLPEASVIIIFHNEAQTILLRTMHSVLDRSPPHLLKEIILVDDFSSFEHLKEPLEEYIKPFGKVRVIRGKKREGLIRARLLGASVATAKALIFLDSHCECTIGWLEPLLDRIAQNWSNVVAPIIDVLADDTLRYQYSSAKSTSVGGFDWNLQFNWHVIPDWERRKHKNPVEPVWSPTMAGGLFGIDREYFEHLGTYDPGMDIWGGENLELSFRVWMCGGTLEQVLCSHVGHIFRKRSPYAWRTGTNVVKKNSIRLAEVWMDDYKKYYYERFNYDLIWMCGGILETVLCSHVGHIFRKRSPYKWRTGVNVVKKNSIRLAEVWMDEYAKYYYERFNYDLGDYGDITARKELRKRLNCKSFDWYMKNIFPELFVPGDSVASGEIRCKALGTLNGDRKEAICVDSAVDKNSYNKAVKIWPCHLQGGNQHWMLSKSGEIRRDEGCIDFAGDFVMIYPCHGSKGNQEWKYGMDNTLRHVNTNRCLSLSTDGTKLTMEPCTGIDRQIWQWKRKDSNITTAAVPKNATPTPKLKLR